MSRFKGYYVEVSYNDNGVQVKRAKYFKNIKRARTFAEGCRAEGGYDYVTIEYVRK